MALQAVGTPVSMPIEKGQIQWVSRLVPNLLPPVPLAEPSLGLGLQEKASN